MLAGRACIASETTRIGTSAVGVVIFCHFIYMTYEHAEKHGLRLIDSMHGCILK